MSINMICASLCITSLKVCSLLEFNTAATGLASFRKWKQIPQNGR